MERSNSLKGGQPYFLISGILWFVEQHLILWAGMAGLPDNSNHPIRAKGLGFGASVMLCHLSISEKYSPVIPSRAFWLAITQLSANKSP